MQRTQPLDWNFEIIGYKTKIDHAQVNWDEVKEYDSLNFEYRGETITSRNWMSKLPDDLKITDISIPGTHDSGSANIPSDGSKRTQQHYIDELMNAGIRHFDLRLGLTDEGILKIIHTPAGIAYGHYGEILTLDLVMEWANGFLESNPDEALIFQIKEDDSRDVVKQSAYNYFKNLALDSNSRLWVGDHVPTLGEARGKIVLISMLGTDGLDYEIEREGKKLRWGINAKNWQEGKIYYYDDYWIFCWQHDSLGLTASGPDYEVWTQDAWNMSGSSKKEYISETLNGLKSKSREGHLPGKWSSAYFHDEALKAGKHAYTFNYTSCSNGPAYTPHSNSKNIHQWIFDGKLFRDDPTSDGQLDPVPMNSNMYTGVMAFDYADELCAKKVYKTNFNKNWITIRGIAGDGSEPFDPIVLPVAKGAKVKDVYSYGLSSIENDWGMRQPTIVNHFTGNGYTPIKTSEGNSTLVRLVDKPMAEYDSKEEFDAAALALNGTVTEDRMTLYVGLEGPQIENVDVVLEVPVCGTQINSEGNPTPNITVPDNPYYKVAQQDGKPVAAWVDNDFEVKCGNSYNETVHLEPKFGYRFAQSGVARFENCSVYPKTKNWTSGDLVDGENGAKWVRLTNASKVAAPDAQLIDKVDPTCEEPGKKAYYICKTCDALYTSDMRSISPFLENYELRIPPLGHVAGESADEVITLATCTEEGSHYHFVSCSRCGKELARSSAIVDAALGHDWIVNETTDADGWRWWTTDGVKINEERTCSRCGLKEKRSHNLEHTTHTPMITIPEQSATCTHDGVQEHYKCEGCEHLFVIDENGHLQEVLLSELIIPAAGHTPKSPVIEHETEPTCTTAGGYDEVVDCETCNALMSSEYVEVEALGHDWGTPTYEADWENGTVTAERVCGRNDEHVDVETAEAKEAITLEPTCEGKGSQYLFAEFKNEAFERQESGAIEIEALGHLWDDGAVTTEPTCSEEGTRTFTCRRDGCGEMRTESIEKSGHEEAVRTLPETDTATCTEPGTIHGEKYCAVCGEALGDIDLTTNPLGHVWDVPSYTWADDKSTVAATRVCTRDGCDGSETETVQTTEVAIKDATCLDAGEKRLEAVFENEDFEKQSEYVEVEALGHDWGEWNVTKPATETAAGERTRACSRCDATEKEVISANGYAPGADPNQMGTDGTAVGPGASAAAADEAITSMKSDADPKGAQFAKLRLRSSKQTKSAIKLNWTKVGGAKSYVIYGNACGKNKGPQKLATVTGTT